MLSNVADAVGELSTLERLGIDPSKPRSEPETRSRLLTPVPEGHRPSVLDLAATYPSTAVSSLPLVEAPDLSPVCTYSAAPLACVSTEGLLLDAIAVNLDRGIARDRNKRATERALTAPLQLSYKLDAPSHHRRYCSEHRPSPLDLLPINAHAPPTRPQAQDRPTSVGVTAVRGTQLRGSPF